MPFYTKQEDNQLEKDGIDRVESDKMANRLNKRKKNKGKTDFEIKNVLQQISSSIQSCVKDGYVNELTDQYLENLIQSGKEQQASTWKKNM